MNSDPISRHFDTDDRGNPDWLGPIAKRVRKLVVQPEVMTRFREQVLEWGQELSSQIKQEREWDDRWRERNRKILEEQDAAGSCPTWLSDAPKPGWVFEEFGLRIDHGAGKIIFGAGWHPPEASLTHKAKEHEMPLPLNAKRTLSIAERYTVLAAIHDATYKGVELLDPWEHVARPTDEFDAIKFDARQSKYSDIVEEARRIPEGDKLSVEALCHDVEADLGVLVDCQDGRALLAAESKDTSVVSSPADIAFVGVTRDIDTLGRARAIAQTILEALPPESLDRPLPRYEIGTVQDALAVLAELLYQRREDFSREGVVCIHKLFLASGSNFNEWLILRLQLRKPPGMPIGKLIDDPAASVFVRSILKRFMGLTAETEPPATSNSSVEIKPAKSRRKSKHASDSAPRLKRDARRDLVSNYIRDKCGGRWDGTQLELQEALLKDKGLKVSKSTLCRDLKGTTYFGKPRRAAGGAGEREAVSADGPVDLSHLDSWTMPDDDVS